MPVLDSKFSNFADGGNLTANDIVVGLRNGINTRFVYDGAGLQYLPLTGGTMQGVISMGGNGITNLLNPLNPQDAATKAYVDGSGSGVYLPLAGGTMTGAINMGSNGITNLPAPSGANDAARKAYVDTFLPLSGGTMSGAINMGSNLINAVTDPVSAQDAATKNYVDTSLVGVYLPLSGGTMAGQIDMNSLKIVNLANPTTGSDACTKSYADSIAAGLIVQPSCQAATTANLNATQSGAGVGATLTNAGVQAAFSVDGYSASLNDSILVKDQTLSQHNGIYTVTTVGDGVTNWVLTRATDYDTPAEITAGDLVAINNGTINGGTAWLETLTVATVDTDPISFSPFAIITAGTGLTKVGNQISLTNPVALSLGGTNAVLTASNGGIVYSTASELAILSGTATDRQIMLSGASSAPSWSPYQMPATAGTAGNVLTSDGTNWISSTPSDANVTITDDTTTNATMYPTWVTANTGTLPLKVTSTKLFYNPSTSTLTNIGALGQVTGLKSSAGLDLAKFNYTASAVNYFELTNSATGNPILLHAGGSDSNIGIAILTKGTGNIQLSNNTGNVLAGYFAVASSVNYPSFTAATTTNSPVIAASGSDTNITLLLNGKGTGSASPKGTGTNDNATAGYLGEYISSTITTGSAVAISPTGTTVNITSITLSAGDWHIWASGVCANNAFGTTAAQIAISTTSATLPDLSLQNVIGGNATVGTAHGGSCAPVRASITANTTYYLVARSNFSSGTQICMGTIQARRLR